ncbi:MAG: methyltransferase domain-containing protein, partial [Armatimonadetes bacterium]|nr:methyltransferase domain-containing protein [Armatimonadota bacterium]
NTNITDFTQPNSLSHFYSYIQEALMELGCEREAKLGMASAARFQQPSGAVPGYSNVNWICSTGLAQLAQVWYMLGEIDRADAAMSFLELIQNPSGGFFGSYGVGAEYFPSEEISWAAKYTIEACQRQISAHFDQTVQIYDSNIDASDGRVQAVINKLGDLNGKRVLDAGCGKGRYSTILKKLYPTAEITAMDISSEMLKHIPSGINKTQAGILAMPFADKRFDAVICIEALEHVVRIDEGIQQLARVTADGGTVLVIDKNVEMLGALQMPSWEKWFSRTGLMDEMTKAGLIADSEFISHSGNSSPDGLFICWTGKKAPKTRSIKVSKIETTKRLKIAYYGNCWMTNVGEAFIGHGTAETGDAGKRCYLRYADVALLQQRHAPAIVQHVSFPRAKLPKRSAPGAIHKHGCICHERDVCH